MVLFANTFLLAFTDCTNKFGKCLPTHLCRLVYFEYICRYILAKWLNHFELPNVILLSTPSEGLLVLQIQWKKGLSTNCLFNKKWNAYAIIILKKYFRTEIHFLCRYQNINSKVPTTWNWLSPGDFLDQHVCTTFLF